MTLACLLLFGTLGIFVHAAELTGLTFDNEDTYILEKEPDATPQTFEATVYLPSNFNMDTRGGVILGNYVDCEACVIFPRIAPENERAS